MRRMLLQVFVPVLLLPLFSCGGGRSSSTNNSTDHAPISIDLRESRVTLAAGESHQFTATLTGTTNTAVNWRMSGCEKVTCGTLNATGLYTAPSNIPEQFTITISAVSTADPTKSAQVAVTHMPVTVVMAPAVGAWVPLEGSVEFSVYVLYDRSNRGVTWALDPTCTSLCGTLSHVGHQSATYTAPLSAPSTAVALIATSVADPNRSARTAISFSEPNMLVEGDYAFVYDGWFISVSSASSFYTQYRVASIGHFHADAKGNITEGEEAVNSPDGVGESIPFSGTYNIGSDGRGSFTIGNELMSSTFELVVDASRTKGKFIRFDGGSESGTGHFELQDSSAFSPSALAGDYAFAISGTSDDWNRLAAVGRFTVDPEGVISSGKGDKSAQVGVGSQPQTYLDNLSLTGSLSFPSTNTGHGTFKLNLGAQTAPNWEINFIYYIVSRDKILLMQSDPRSFTNVIVMSGEARRQHGPFTADSLRGSTVFSMSGSNRANYGAFFEHVAIGQMVADGSGALTGALDDAGQTYESVSAGTLNGTYSVEPSGRAMLRVGTGSLDGAVAYFFDANEAFLMQTQPGNDVLLGSIQPQATGPFDAASIAGRFLTIAGAPATEQVENQCGVTTFDGKGSFSTGMDTNNNLHDDPSTWLRHLDLKGTYTVAPNGRGTMSFDPSSSRGMVFWIISPGQIVANAGVPVSGWSTLLDLEK